MNQGSGIGEQGTGVRGQVTENREQRTENRGQGIGHRGQVKKLALSVLILLLILLLPGCRDGRPPNKVNTLEDVRDRIIGALYGTPSARLAGELGVPRTFYSGSELIYALTAGTVDCAVMESVAANELISETTGVRILNETLLEYELRFAVPRENAQLLDVVNSALAALNSNGTLKNLRDKYFSGKDYTYAPPEGIEPHPGSLTLATSSDSPPYSYKDRDGNYTGLDIEVARAVCDHLGVEMDIIEVEAKDLVTAVWFGRADLAAGWLPGDVDEQVNVSDDYANIAQVVIVRK